MWFINVCVCESVCVCMCVCVLLASLAALSVLRQAVLCAVSDVIICPTCACQQEPLVKKTTCPRVCVCVSTRTLAYSHHCPANQAALSLDWWLSLGEGGRGGAIERELIMYRGFGTVTVQTRVLQLLHRSRCFIVQQQQQQQQQQPGSEGSSGLSVSTDRECGTDQRLLDYGWLSWNESFWTGRLKDH